jgi:hypothetical protein
MKTNKIIKTLRDIIAGHWETDGIPTEELILAANRLQEQEASILHIIRQAAEAQDEREKKLAIWLRNRLNRALQMDEWQRFSLEELLKELELVRNETRKV